ncbi:hypothetical protein [Pseudomonas sp. FW305-127]|uniref:hypothetical protein n=1 Tax=unclassified Pseudomonas TaxID=196821 RepID=UPI0035323C58
MSRVPEIFLQRCAQLLLLILQAAGEARTQTLTRTDGKAVEPSPDILPGLLQFGSQFLAVIAQARPQIGLQGGYRAPRQCNGNQYLHQKSDTKRNKHRPQEATS